MKKGDKRGLSGVVTTLIIILLSLVAVVTIWVVIRNIVESGSEQIQLGQYTVDLDLQKAVSIPAGTQVTLTRKPGQGAMNGLKFIVSDGVNSYIYDQKDITLNELETKTFTINHTGPIKSVSVAPLIKTGTTDTAQNVVDDMKFSSYEAAKGMNGLVSWWRLEGNANDEMGLNNGTLSNPAPILVNGKYGKAYNFTGMGENITISDNASLRLQNQNMTMIAWINFDDLTLSQSYFAVPIIYKGGGGSDSGNPLMLSGYALYIKDTIGDGISAKSHAYTNAFSSTPNRTMQRNSWNHLAVSTNLTSLPGTLTWISYINGYYDRRTNKIGMGPMDSTGIDLSIGLDDYPNPMFGIIDEVMIFNRTLSADEIKALYSLDLSDK